jgi:hypothetical protein
MLTKNQNINKYLNNRGDYNPLLSENIRESYKNSSVKKEVTPKKILDHNPVTRLINRIFKIKSKK